MQLYCRNSKENRTILENANFSTMMFIAESERRYLENAHYFYVALLVKYYGTCYGTGASFELTSSELRDVLLHHELRPFKDTDELEDFIDEIWHNRTTPNQGAKP